MSVSFLECYMMEIKPNESNVIALHILFYLGAELTWTEILGADLSRADY